MIINGEAKKILGALAVASILGGWGFAATRASSGDIDAVREEIAEVEVEAKERHERLEATVEEINDTIQIEAINAAVFRTQVRMALEIRSDGE